MGTIMYIMWYGLFVGFVIPVFYIEVYAYHYYYPYYYIN